MRYYQSLTPEEQMFHRNRVKRTNTMAVRKVARTFFRLVPMRIEDYRQAGRDLVLR
jgi:hypothetical protein